MQAEEYSRMYSLEDRYWWFVGRRQLALGILQRQFSNSERPKVLDLGCGTGVVLGELQKWTDPVGLDMSPLALEFCHSRGIYGVTIGRGEAMPFPDNTFDAVIALDLFEHIEDDMAAYAETIRVLKPGGVLVMSVPAFRWLWGPHDRALMHFRRYRKAELRDKLRGVGFSVEKISYSVFFLFPIVVLIRLFEKMKHGQDHASLPPVPGFVNRFLVWLQSVEAWLMRGTSLPWGSSVVALARKPGNRN